MVLLEENKCRINENFTLFRVEKSVMVPLLVIASGSFSGSSGIEGDGCWSVKWNSLSKRIIWLKLGLMLGSSTQHDCMIKARSGDISSGRLGLSCCKLKCKPCYDYQQIQYHMIIKRNTEKKRGYSLHKYGQWKNKFWWLCAKIWLFFPSW